MPSSNGVTLCKEENGISPDTQVIIREQDQINNVIRHAFPPRVISVTDSEFEYELANLVYGHPEKDYAENPLVAPTFKSSEV